MGDCSGTCQLDDLLRGIELFNGIQFQEHDTEKALLTITQKEREYLLDYQVNLDNTYSH